MVHIRKAYPVSLKTAKSTPEQPNDRLVTLIWKSNDKVGRVAHSSRCFSIPAWFPHLEANYRQYAELLAEAVHDLQDRKAHKYVTECLNSNNGVCNDIPAELLEADTVLAEWKAEQEANDGSRGKISGEQINAWFDAVLKDTVQQAIADKKGWLETDYTMTPEDVKSLQQAANNYKACLARLAAPQPRVDVNTAKALIKVVELLPENERGKDMIAAKVTSKLDRIINPVVIQEGELMDML